MALAGLWSSVAYLVVAALVVVGFVLLIVLTAPPQDDFTPVFPTSTSFELPTTSTSVPR